VQYEDGRFVGVSGGCYDGGGGGIGRHIALRIGLPTRTPCRLSRSDKRQQAPSRVALLA